MKQLFSLTLLIITGAVIALGPPSAALAETETHEVAIRKFNFQPPDLLILAGDTVIWENEMPYGHWVISGEDLRHDNRFFSPMLLQGHTFSITFREPGEYTYYCPIHNMQAMVIVLEPDDAKPADKKKYGTRRRIR